MKQGFAEAMRQATLATRANDLARATKIILRAVTGRGGTNEGDMATSEEQVPRRSPPSTLRLIDPTRESVEQAPQKRRSTAPPIAERPDPNLNLAQSPVSPRKPLGDVLQALRDRQLSSPELSPAIRIRPRRPPPPPSDGAQFLDRSFSCAAGARNYKLFVPALRSEDPRGLIVMLHGCTQDPDDFALGTNMNAIAEAHGLMVAYPEQSRSANATSCWNWFNPAHQRRDGGEPSIIAGLTREVISRLGPDRRRVFVAGLSAGGAMAAVMGETYPDVFAAVGVHSGLPYQSAIDVASAFATMRGSAGKAYAEKPNLPQATKAGVPTIVFHGARDRTVHPSNGDRVVELACARLPTAPDPLQLDGFEGGRSYTRTIFKGPAGAPVAEFWRIDGAGHAWSGGQGEGSFADPKGPNASAEMVRFFLAQAPAA